MDPDAVHDVVPRNAPVMPCVVVSYAVAVVRRFRAPTWSVRLGGVRRAFDVVAAPQRGGDLRSGSGREMAPGVMRDALGRAAGVPSTQRSRDLGASSRAQMMPGMVAALERSRDLGPSSRAQMMPGMVAALERSRYLRFRRCGQVMPGVMPSLELGGDLGFRGCGQMVAFVAALVPLGVPPLELGRYFRLGRR